jgi:uncharacterized protein (TIGR03435 family)
MRFLILAIALAQAPTEHKEFDLVSIKPSAPDERNRFLFQNLPGGTVRIAGVPLRMIMMQAFDVKAFQITGGPDWVRMDRWDIQAKAEGVAGRLPRAEENPMLQALMRDRFQLQVHRATKEMPIYALVVEKNGSKLVPSTSSQRHSQGGLGSIAVQKGGMNDLASWLSGGLGRVVIDKTGLSGEYDYKLEWTPEPGEGGPESIGLPPDGPRPHVDGTGPSIFTAVQEQLGLRLVSQKGPVEMVVIDRVEKPTAN